MTRAVASEQQREREQTRRDRKRAVAQPRAWVLRNGAADDGWWWRIDALAIERAHRRRDAVEERRAAVAAAAGLFAGVGRAVRPRRASDDEALLVTEPDGKALLRFARVAFRAVCIRRAVGLARLRARADEVAGTGPRRLGTTRAIAITEAGREREAIARRAARSARARIRAIPSVDAVARAAARRVRSDARIAHAMRSTDDGRARADLTGDVARLAWPFAFAVATRAVDAVAARAVGRCRAGLAVLLLAGAGCVTRVRPRAAARIV